MKARVSAVMVLCLVFLASAPAGAQIHCSELPPLTLETTFPRCDSRELAVAGFPDHMHAYTWSGWEVLTDSEGNTYGPQSMCLANEVIPREGLVIKPDRKSYGQFVLEHNPGYGDCDMIQFLEIMDWANHDVSELLGLAATDSLTVVNPDNLDHYRELTGLWVWRFYSLDGDHCVMQPFPVLMSRTLVSHAVFLLVTDWILQETIEADLPPWLHQGIMEYMSEDGMHLLSFVGEFRLDYEILQSPAQVDERLAMGVDPDDDTDRQLYRLACYNSFLMVWQLVEHEGGLTALREFLDFAATGMDLDLAARRVYGMDLEQLAAYLDPVTNGEPLPKDMNRPRANIPP